MMEEAMADQLNTFLFGIYPYIALSVFVTGNVIRFDREQYSWRSGSSQLLRRRQLVLGSNLFHVGILVIFAGHLVGLLTPIQVFEFLGVTHGQKQILAMTAGGIAGAICLIGLIMLLYRRLSDSRIFKTSSFWDIAVLIMLLGQLMLGLLSITVSARHLGGEEMVRFMFWAQGIFTLDPAASSYAADAHIIFKLHLVLGLTIFLVFPFTRLVHVLSAPVWYLGRRGWQIVRTNNARKPA
jgi:nitrate reductase gamma subunit